MPTQVIFNLDSSGKPFAISMGRKFVSNVLATSDDNIPKDFVQTTHHEVFRLSLYEDVFFAVEEPRNSFLKLVEVMDSLRVSHLYSHNSVAPLRLGWSGYDVPVWFRPDIIVSEKEVTEIFMKRWRELGVEDRAIELLGRT
jgi:hypothetical protein